MISHLIKTRDTSHINRDLVEFKNTLAAVLQDITIEQNPLDWIGNKQQGEFEVVSGELMWSNKASLVLLTNDN